MRLNFPAFRHCFLLFAAVLLFPAAIFSQVTLSTGTVNFFTVYTHAPESLSVTVNNGGTADFIVTDVNLYHDDVMSVDDTAFVVPAGGSYTIWVTCSPRHNLNYLDYLYFVTPSQPASLQALVYANCKYPDTYYDATQNKWHEDLKLALKTTISTGTVDLGYNTARDKMYMEIDNQMVNGQGASQNTLECIYTGDLAVGYTSRSDCQTNYAFNTEHTFPQSMFGSSSPMLSDLHHIFPTKDYANSERANKPFGVVSSPSWSVGGSKSNASTFEPRDVHKGNAARALFYMVIRYQDYTGFVAPQENILRQWCLSFPPTSVDSIRNEDIYGFQNNRNPFIDHPEFFERIASICNTNNGILVPDIHASQDTLQFGSTSPGTPVSGTFYLSNQGNAAMTLSGIAFGDASFTTTIAAPVTIQPDSLLAIPVTFDPQASNQDYTVELTLTTNDPDQGTFVTWLKGNSNPAATNGGIQSHLEVFPNPAGGAARWVTVRFAAGEISELALTDLNGKVMNTRSERAGLAEMKVSLEGVARGLYLLQILTSEGPVCRLLRVE